MATVDIAAIDAFRLGTDPSLQAAWDMVVSVPSSRYARLEDRLTLSSAIRPRRYSWVGGRSQVMQRAIYKIQRVDF